MDERRLPIVEHWRAGARWAGKAERHGDVHDPATGGVSRRVGLASRGRRRRSVVAGAAAAGREWRRGLAHPAHAGAVRVPRAAVAPAQGRAGRGRSPPSTARCSPTRSARCTRGLEVVEFACGVPHLLKGGFTEGVSTGVDVYSIRQPLGVVGGDLAVQLPGDGADVVRSRWRSRAATPSCSSRARRTRRPSLLLAELWAEAGLPDGVFNVVHGDKEAVDALLEHPDVAAVSFVGSTPIARYVYETGDRARQAGAGARRREEPHGGAARRRPRPRRRRRGQRRLRLGGRAVHGDLGRRRGRPGRRRAGRADRRADGRRCASATDRRGGDMGPLVTERAPRQGGVVRRRRRRARARSWSSTAATSWPTATRTASGSARRCSTVSTPGMSIYRDEIFGPVLSVVRVDVVRRGGRAGQRQPLRQRHGDLHPRRRRGPALPARGRGRHGRRQRADPGADGVLLVRRLEVLAVRRHPRPRHRRRALLHPRQGRHLPLAGPGGRRGRRRGGRGGPAVPEPLLAESAQMCTRMGRVGADGPRGWAESAQMGRSEDEVRSPRVERAFR